MQHQARERSDRWNGANHRASMNLKAALDLRDLMAAFVLDNDNTPKNLCAQ
jgi:hypothetical protein